MVQSKVSVNVDNVSRPIGVCEKNSPSGSHDCLLDKDSSSIEDLECTK